MNAQQFGQQAQRTVLELRQQEAETRRMELENERMELELIRLREDVRLQIERQNQEENNM